jgi:hypothetical protein
MKTFLRLAAAFGLAACLTSSTANAQGGRGMGMGMGQSGVSLLVNKSVQKELKLSDEQIEKATKASTDLNERRQEKFGELRDLEQAERQEKMQALGKEFAAESKKLADGIIKPEQAKRFGEISVQVMGFSAFNDADIQKKLSMTDEQKNKIKDMQQEMMDKATSIREEFQNDQAGRTKKMTELRDELKSKATTLLTDDQKKTWKEMTGEPFAFVPEAPRRPGGN